MFLFATDVRKLFGTAVRRCRRPLPARPNTLALPPPLTTLPLLTEEIANRHMYGLHESGGSESVWVSEPHRHVSSRCDRRWRGGVVGSANTHNAHPPPRPRQAALKRAGARDLGAVGALVKVLYWLQGRHLQNSQR